MTCHEVQMSTTECNRAAPTQNNLEGKSNGIHHRYLIEVDYAWGNRKKGKLNDIHGTNFCNKWDQIALF